MDKDVTGLGSFLNTWLPSKFNETIVPQIDKHENTLNDLHSNVLNGLKNQIGQQRLALATKQGMIGNAIDDKLTPLESNLDNLHRKVLDAVDLRMIPVHSNVLMNNPPNLLHLDSKLDTCPPCTFPVADPAIGGGVTCVPRTGDPECSPSNGGGIIDHPVPTECPPQQECPPQHECPPIGECPICHDCPPQSCIYVDMYVRHCRENPDACLYIVLTGYPPLSKDDLLIGNQLTCDQSTFEIWIANLKRCPKVPLCQVKPTPLGGNGNCQIENVCPPNNPIINFMNPPGSIVNVTPEPFTPPRPDYPVLNPPIIFPPYITPFSPGSLINISIGMPKPGQDTCFPSGDYSLALQNCDDGSKTAELSKELMGKSINDFIESKMPLDWWKEQYDKVKESVLDIPVTTISVPSSNGRGGK